ncbi:MAG: glutamine-hydrolyzing carbamoyl-phosphate synthase small subunit [Proteobacteria bacterium]|nr:glutamine-hydrolyzing carbamoyl-phosphate synthase small subunit [Pseudomonadota bacterium]
MPRFALLALEDGSLFEGVGFGHLSHPENYALGEVVFNTAMTGYQEILTDPSYANQLITLTYPHIGNVGVNKDDKESEKIYAKGLIIRQLPYQASNWRYQSSLEAFLSENRVLGIAEIDTRRLTRLIREKGAMRGCILSAPQMSEEIAQKALQLCRSSSSLEGLDLAKEVSTPFSYQWAEKGLWSKQRVLQGSEFHVVAYDFGIKKTILRCLYDLGCRITIVNAKTTAEDVLSLAPDGVFLSNGPGDPKPCQYAIDAIKHFMHREMPLFGICLGHQLLALACGAQTHKMKFGHHGGNHPVRDLENQKVLITSQNHGFVVDEQSLNKEFVITHRSLFDNTLQGFKHRTLPLFGFQGHPEAGPGPNDARQIFNPFIEAMLTYRKQSQKSSTIALELN